MPSASASGGKGQFQESPMTSGAFERSGPGGGGGGAATLVPVPPGTPEVLARGLKVGRLPLASPETIPYPGPSPSPVTNPLPVKSSGSSSFGAAVSTLVA